MVKRIVSKLKTLCLRLLPKKMQARLAGVKMGNNNFISSEFWGAEPYLITIGSHCQITHGVKFFTHGGGAAVRKLYPKFDCFGKISIGDYVYLGNNTLIMPGVSIGDNVLVAAGSVITKSIPSNLVIGGNPATVICTLKDYIENNEQYNLNSKGMSFKEKKKLLLATPPEKFIIKKQIKINSHPTNVSAL